MTTASLSLHDEAQESLASRASNGIFRRVRKGLRRVAKESRKPASRDLQRLRRLLQASPSQWFSQIAEDPRLLDRRVCTWLLRESQSLLSLKSADARHLAELALFVAQRLDPRAVPTVLVVDYQAQAWIQIGGVQTIAGELQKASLALQMAGCLLSSGSGDVEQQGDFLGAKARLYQARGEDELARRADLRARRIVSAKEVERFCS